MVGSDDQIRKINYSYTEKKENNFKNENKNNGSYNRANYYKYTCNCPYCGDLTGTNSENTFNCHLCRKLINFNGSKANNETALSLLMGAIAKIAKAGGSIKEVHINLIEDMLINELKFNKETKNDAIKYFREAKDDKITFYEYCLKYRNIINEDDNIEDKYNLFHMATYFIYKLAICDGDINANANEFINCAIGIFKISAEDFAEIKKMFDETDDDNRYYEVLGCKKGDSLEVIKTKYRKLVKEYHPDKTRNLNISDEIRKELFIKFIEVQEAYELIKLQNLSA